MTIFKSIFTGLMVAFFFLAFANQNLSIEQVKEKFNKLLLNTPSEENQQDIIKLIKEYSTDDSIIARVRQMALKKDNFIIRRYLMETNFAAIKEKFAENSESKNSLLNQMKIEFLLLKERKLTSAEDRDTLLFLFEIVKNYKLENFFYETIAFIGFPLYDIRRAAYSALAEIRDDRIFPFILQLATSREPIEKTYALDSLYYIKDERLYPLLITLLDDVNKSVRYYALRTLEQMNRSEAIPHYLRIIQSDVNYEVQIKAMQIIANLKPANGFFALIKKIEDKHPMVRETAVHSLMAYNDKNACMYFSTQLKLETEHHIKLLLIKSLITLKNSGGMVGLNHLMAHEPNLEIKLWAIWAVRQIQDQRGYDVLIDLLKHRDDMVKAEAALTLGSFQEKKSADRILQLLQESDSYFVQAAAIEALKKILADNVLAKIFNLSEDHPSLKIRRHLKIALRDMLQRRF